MDPITDPKMANPNVVNAIARERRSFPVLADLVKKLFDARVKDAKSAKPFHSVIEEAKTLMKERVSHCT